MRRIRILVLVLMAAAFAVAVLAARICWPTSLSDKRKVAAGMIEFYNQPAPHWNENMPASLTERDRQHYRFEPSSDVKTDYVAVGYDYRRFGIDYEQNFYLFRGLNRKIFINPNLPVDTNDTTWTLMSERRTWLPWGGVEGEGHWFYLREQPITITNTP